MKSLINLLVITALFWLSGCASTTKKPLAGSQIISSSNKDGYALTVAESKLILAIPKLNLNPMPLSKNASPRYFYYYDEVNGIGMSGWFEPQHRYAGIEQHWHDFLKKWPGDKPENVTFMKIGDWSAVSYELTFQGMQQQNIKAHLVKDGTWLDIHVSQLNSSSNELINSLVEALIVANKNITN